MIAGWNRARLAQFGDLLRSPGAAWAAITWRPFSLSAYSITRALKTADIPIRFVVDVGANEGQFSRAMRAMYGREVSIFGFEPLRSTFDRLASNFQDDGQARFQRLALGSREAAMDMHVNSFSQSSSLMKLGEKHRFAFPWAQEVGIETVQVKRLDEVMAGVEIERPALLKIDVQGYELEVLSGATGVLASIDHVLVEVGLVSMYEGEPSFAEVDGLLTKFRFRFVRPIATLKVGNVPVQIDALFSRI